MVETGVGARSLLIGYPPDAAGNVRRQPVRGEEGWGGYPHRKTPGSRIPLRRPPSDTPHTLSQSKQKDRDRLADWVAHGSKGATPDSEVAFREEKIKDLQRRLEGVNYQIVRVLGEKASHVERHRPRLVKDASKATAAAERRYAELIDEAERARQEAVELREAELWALTFPEVRQGEEQIPPGVAGNLRAPLKKAGIDHALEPGSVFDLLREDAGWIPGAVKPELKEKLGAGARPGGVDGHTRGRRVAAAAAARDE